MHKFLLLMFILSFFTYQNTYALSKGISNMTKATDGIFRGGRPLSDSEYQVLSDNGIKSILNLQGGDTQSLFWKIYPRHEPGEKQVMIEIEKEKSKNYSFNFLNTPLLSLGYVTEEEDKLINSALDFMHLPENHPVYVHCEHGVDRTGLLIALYKVKYENLDPKLAKKEWANLGHNYLSRILTNSLDEYYEAKVEEIINEKLKEKNLLID